jgi:hypothetical protein
MSIIPPVLKLVPISRTISDGRQNLQAQPCVIDAIIVSFNLPALAGNLVEAEVDLASGFPGFATVGLPGNIVKESNE